MRLVLMVMSIVKIFYIWEKKRNQLTVLTNVKKGIPYYDEI